MSPGSTTGGAATGPSRIPMSTFLAGITPGSNNTLTRLDVDAQGNAQDVGAGLKIVRDIGDYTFTSITSYDLYQLDDRQDTDSTDINFAAYQPVSPPGGSANGGYFDIESKTQEFRLTSPEQRLRYVAGLFYSDTELDSLLRAWFKPLRRLQPLADAFADTREPADDQQHRLLALPVGRKRN